MSLATKQTQEATIRRIWKAPTSYYRWIWLGVSVLIYGGLLAWYFYALSIDRFAGPFKDPLRLFGIIAFLLLLSTAAYTLRRRFARGLPGKVQDWLWMHTWFGITTILVALLHDKFKLFFPNITSSYMGGAALIGLFILVLSGVIGRIIDVWQTHIIARDASSNGVGIIRALEERIVELELVVERLCAGKSDPFQEYCLAALELDEKSKDLNLPEQIPALKPNEHPDFQKAYETLTERVNLLHSLQVQRKARLIISAWRSVHMALAGLSLLAILYHSVMQLLVSVLKVIPRG